MERVTNKEKKQALTKIELNKQLLRSATSVLTNYNAACKISSKAEYFSKICIIAEEAKETQFLIEMLINSGSEDEKIKIMHSEISKIIALSTLKGV